MSLNPVLDKAPLSRWVWNPRVACALTLTLVFLCGAVVGALAHNSLHRGGRISEAGKTIYLERLRKDLDLTPAQVEQMGSILEDFAVYYHNVLSDGRSRIEQILNDDQRVKFERLLQERQRQ